jgi:hypothetical protein
MACFNSTGANWTAFRWEFGFTVQGNYQISKSGLNFAKTPTPWEYGEFQPVKQQTYTLDWSNGSVANNQSDTFWFAINVPNFDATTMPEGAKTVTGYQFTIRGTPNPGQGGGAGGGDPSGGGHFYD